MGAAGSTSSLLGLAVAVNSVLRALPRGARATGVRLELAANRVILDVAAGHVVLPRPTPDMALIQLRAAVRIAEEVGVSRPDIIDAINREDVR